MKYLPKWFPGAGFQAAAEKGAKLSRDMQYVPYMDARDKMVKLEEEYTFSSIDRCLCSCQEQESDHSLHRESRNVWGWTVNYPNRTRKIFRDLAVFVTSVVLVF